ncbi:MAG: ArnT family glycosyltransferase, partial [Candidatus Binatia bacterium]
MGRKGPALNRYLFFSLLTLGIAFRIVLLTQYEFVNGGEVDVYLADEGVVGLMGKHILEAREAPVFFYGQAYLGALEAYLAALSFSLFGVNLLGLRLVTLAFSFVLLGAVYTFTYRIYSVAAARWATALVAVSPMYFLQWNLKARGGFIEHIVLLFFVMMLFWRFYLGHDRRRSVSGLLGFVSGVAFWVNQLMLSYLIPMTVLVAREGTDRRGLKSLLVGFCIGASLLIGYNVVHPLATFRSLARKSVVLNRVPIEKRDEMWLVRGIAKRVEGLGHSAAKLGMVFGVPPGEELAHLGLNEQARAGGDLTPLRRGTALVPLLVFGVAFAGCRPRRSPDGWIWRGSDQLLALFTLMTFAVGYVSPRYMLPAYPLAAVMSGVLVTRLRDRTRRSLMVAGIVAVLAFN